MWIGESCQRVTPHFVRRIMGNRWYLTIIKWLSETKTIRIGVWNVRTLYQCGKIKNVIQEMKHLKINIMGVCETRLKRSGDITTEDHQIIYACGESQERGVIWDRERARCVLTYWQLTDRILLMKIQGRWFNISIIVVYVPIFNCNEEEIDMFYDHLDIAKAQCKSQEIIPAMGDVNAKVGSEGGSDMVGKHGLGIWSEHGEWCFQWCTANNQIINNTWFNITPEDYGLGKAQEGT